VIPILVVLGCVSEDKDSADTPGDSVETAGHSGESDASGESGESEETDDPCDVDTGPSFAILDPDQGSSWLVGDEVPLHGSEGNAYGVAATRWYVDDALIAETIDASWVASGAGPHTVQLEIEAECRGGTTGVTIQVAEPADPTVLVYDEAEGIPVAAWYGLSLAADGTIWGATSVGLVHFDPLLLTSRVYTSADGLLSDTPRAVLAASDGTIWVGHAGTDKRQGEQLSIAGDGTPTILQPIDYTESYEITSVYRLREQPYGAGVGDVWMGTNEGLCLWDADLGVFAEHAHPTHPHDTSDGLAFTPDGDVWNGDDYQLSRWHYSNDGDLSPSADLAEYWVPWPVDIEEPVGITDMDLVDDGDGESLGTLWLASSYFGVARVTVGGPIGTSTTECLVDPFPATAAAIRDDGDGHVWIGATDGVYVWDLAGGTMAHHAEDWLPVTLVQQIAVDRATSPPTTWIATAYGLVQVVGLGE
jgi:ligand-binding sensor domain-containing protein